MHSYLAGACKNMESPPLKVGGVEDHVHVACRLSRKISMYQTPLGFGLG
jgi:hypothetical protein